MIDPEIPVHVVHFDIVPTEHLAGFIDSVERSELPIAVHVVDTPGPWAAVEWYVPTAVALYLSKSYFDGFLKEAGKDHYLTIKKAVSGLWSKFFGNDRAIKIQIISSAPMKLSKNRYSATLSVMAYAADKKHFKLLLDDEITQDDLEAAVNTFLRFVAHFHAGVLEEAQRERLLRGASSSVLPVFYDRKTDRIVIADSRPGPPASS